MTSHPLPAQHPSSWKEATSLAKEMPPKEARDLLENALPLAKRLRPARLRMIEAELACRDPQAARRWFKALSPKGRASPEAIRSELMILKAESRDTDLCRKGARALTKEVRLSQRNLLDLARAAVTLGRGKVAVRYAEMALARAPANPSAIQLYYSGTLLVLDDSELLKGMRKALFKPGNGPEHAVGLARLWSERAVPLPMMRKLVTQARERWPDAPKLARTARILFPPDSRPDTPTGQLAKAKEGLRQDIKAMPAGAEGFDAVLNMDAASLTRPLADPSDLAEMVISPPGDSGTVVLHFQGHPGMPVGIDVLDAFHSQRGETAAYLRCDRRLLFQNGLASFGETLEDTVAALKAWLASVNCQRLICIARSGGSLGALPIGQALGADRIICFSPVTTVASEQMQAMNDLRAPVQIKRLNSVIPASQLDLLQAMGARDNRPRMDLIYGAENRIDCLQAERFADFPGATLYPIAGYAQHPSVQYALGKGIYDAILEDRMEAVTNA